MTADERFMHVAICLAKKAEGLTSPNPIVGAVIVKNRKIVGKGYHKRCGLPHAEINAIKDAGKHTKGSTLYVTLEPCDHFGRTGPCTFAIIRSGIRKVVIGMKDPNPTNNGRGIFRLIDNGIETVIGVLEDEAKAINAQYIKYIYMPYITVKIAESLDGKIATRTGDSRWITSEDSRLFVHRLRAKADAVMVGVNTVLKDDPMLLSKTSPGKQPARIIVDSRLRTPFGAKIFSKPLASPVVIAAIKRPRGQRRVKLYEARGARVLFLESKKGKVNLRKLFIKLARIGIRDILVEGGGELVWSLIEEKLVDRFLFFIAPKIIGGRRAPGAVGGKGIGRMSEVVALKNLKIRRFKNDILVEAEA